MLVATRFVVDPAEESAFRLEATAALAALAARPGWQAGRLARALDDPATWLLLTEWRDVGSWRRALGGYDVKLAATPLLARALAEPTAYEVLYDVVDGAARATASDRAE